VLVVNQLFATLDPTVRRLRLPGGRWVTISDTVGFVRKLPHELVEAFRSTLEEVTVAALILHVADVSARDVEEQVAAVRDVLAEIGAGEIPELLVLNKVDLLSEVERARIGRMFPDGVFVSALEGDSLDLLAVRLEETLPAPPIEVELMVPYERQDVVARLYEEADVAAAEPKDSGTFLKVRVDERQLARVREFVVRRVSRRLRLPG
jgi:GTP-binding protein HflX